MSSAGNLESIVDDLLLKWEDSLNEGNELSAEELCQDYPQLISELQAKIEQLKRVPPIPRFDANSQSAANLEIVRKIGEGSMGEVYLCKQTSPKRLVAVKFLKSTTQGRTERFDREANALAKLQHPGIAAIHDSGVWPSESTEVFRSKPYLVMEYVQGRHPVEYATRLSHDDTTKLIVDILDAVTHAHQQGVIHRDIKPTNILITSEGQPKLLDFGTAKFVEADGQELTIELEQAFLGTLAYMSPEQVHNPSTVDVRTDIYAVAAVAYEMYTERQAVDIGAGEDVLSIYKKITEQSPPPMSSHGQQFPRDLENVIAKGLSGDLAIRYQAASEFADDLRRYLLGKPVLARPVSTFEQVRRWAKHNPLITFLGAICVALLFLATALSLISGRNARKHATEIRTAMNDVTTAKLEAETARTLAESRLEVAQRATFNMSVLRASNHVAFDPITAASMLDNEELCPDQLRDFAWKLLRQAAAQTVIQDSRLSRNPTVVDFPSTKESTLLVGDDDGGLRVLGLEPFSIGEKINVFDGHRVTCLAANNDGSIVGVGSITGVVKLFRFPSMEQIHESQGGDRAKQIGFNAASDCLVVFRDGVIRRIEGPEYEGFRETDLGRTLRRSAINPSATRVFLSTSERELIFVDVESEETKAIDRGERRRDPISSLAFADDDTGIEFISNSLIEWDAFNGKQSDHYPLPWAGTMYQKSRGVEFVSRGPRQWYVRPTSSSTDRFERLRWHNVAPVSDFAASSDERWLAFPSKAQPVTIWDLEPLSPQRIVTENSGPNDIEFSPKGELFFAGNHGHVGRVPLAAEPDYVRISDHPIHALAVSDDGSAIVAASSNVIYVLDANTLSVKSKHDKAHSATDVAFVGKAQVAIADAAGTISVWNCGDNSMLEVFRQPEQLALCDIVRDADSSEISFTDRKRRVYCYDLEQRKLKWQEPFSGTLDLTVARDTKRSYLFTCFRRYIFKFDLSDGRQVSRLANSDSPMQAIALSPDGMTIATVNAEGDVELWDSMTGLKRLTLPGDGTKGNDIEFSPDGKSLAVASSDKKILIWRLEEQIAR